MILLESVKLVHVTCALLSGTGFLLRGILMTRDSALLQAKLTKVAPHVVDTLLLVSAIILASEWGWAALTMPWLLAKIIALLLYIVVGAVALRHGRTKTIRIAAWLIALGLFAYIVAVAISKNPVLIA